MKTLRRRRLGIITVVVIVVIAMVLGSGDSWQTKSRTVIDQQADATAAGPDAQPGLSSTASPANPMANELSQSAPDQAETALATLPVKGRAAKTGYTRAQFGNGWASVAGCSTREIILKRDLTGTTINDKCQVLTGTLNDPYTGKMIQFVRGVQTSAAVQIDHVVALSNAWQTGAQALSEAVRKQLANDPLELLAVDGPANQQKGDGDAATWLPSNKSFRCQYVARQVAVKVKYGLWVTQAEHDAMARILANCPGEPLPTP